jgi:hypothetical protein
MITITLKLPDAENPLLAGFSDEVLALMFTDLLQEHVIDAGMGFDCVESVTVTRGPE